MGWVVVSSAAPIVFAQNPPVDIPELENETVGFGTPSGRETSLR
jgi:hypothetical protein